MLNNENVVCVPHEFVNLERATNTVGEIARMLLGFFAWAPNINIRLDDWVYEKIVKQQENLMEAKKK